MSDETIEKTFQVTAPAHLTITNIRGSITIQPGEAGVIEVKAVKHGNFDSGRYMVEMTQDSDGSVRVETRSNEALFTHPRWNIPCVCLRISIWMRHASAARST
jgi:hypothetical protein